MKVGDRVRYVDNPKCTGTVAIVKGKHGECVRVTRDRPVDYGKFISTWVETAASLWEPIPPGGEP